MAFWKKLFQGSSKNKKKDYPNITSGADPLEKWRKIGELGDGAFGTVFKAEHVESGRLAALKRVPIRDETELEDFMVEIDILAECRHLNIVQLYEAYFFDSTLWIFIEFCSGGAVDDIIVELDHGLSEPQIRCIAKQMFSALQFLHESCCIHRDLKAGNILLMSDGTIRLADFGVSAKDQAKGKHKHDTFIGTPYWMAPEVAVCETNKDSPYDSKADIWSAGITLIELADMNPPHHEMSPMRVVLKIVRSSPPMLEIPSKWSSQFNDFLSKCLVKDPSGRLSAADLLSHSFIDKVSDFKPLRILYQEVKSEVEEIVEELAEDADLLHDPEHTEETVSESNSISETMFQSPSLSEPPVATKLCESQSELGPDPIVLPDTRSGLEGTPVAEVNSSTEPKAKAEPTVQSSRSSDTSENSIPSGEGSQRLSSEDTKKEEYKYATLSRVRKFKVDGQVIQSTTKKIVDVRANRTVRDNKKYQQMRKQDFRELKQLQREEMKEATDFYSRIRLDKDAQEKKFELEIQELHKRYESELDVMNKRHRKESDRQESHHIQQFRSRAKGLKQQQSKDLKRFKDKLKEEDKLALKSAELQAPKDGKKQYMSGVKAQSNAQRMKREQQFSSKQAQTIEEELKRIFDEQKEERKTLELRFLDAQQDLKRSHTSVLWEMEQRHKQERHQQLKQQVREAFHMQRHQMHVRHQKEVELQGRRDQFQVEELRQQQLLEKRQLPKRLKAEHKALVAELRKAARNKRTDNDREKLRQLDEQYVRKSQLETELMNEKHEKSMETLRAELDANMRDLQEIQNEKKMQLTQQETNKIKERDEQHTQELREWRSDLAKRKRILEDEFQRQREERDRFYSADRPLPKQLRSSLSMPDASWDAAQRSVKARSVTDLQQVAEVPDTSMSHQPLDDVVLGHPSLTSDNGSTNVPNGNS